VSVRHLLTVLLALCFVAPTAAQSSAEDRWISVLSSTTTSSEKLRACVELQVVGTDRAIPHLAPLLPDPVLGHAARHALAGIPSPAASRVLREALGSGNPPDAIGLVASLAARRDVDAVPLLERLVTAAPSSSTELTRVAVAGLGEIGGRDARRTLERFLTSPELAESAALALLRDADRALAGGDRPTAARSAAGILAAPVPEHVRESALRLHFLAEPEQLPQRWRDALLSRDALQRRVALAVTADLAPAGFRELARAVLPRLSEEDRAALLDLWLQRPAPPTVADALPLLNENALPLRSAAVRILAAVGDASAVPALLRFAAAGGNERAAARVALTRVGGPGVTRALVAALASDGEGPQVEALRALGERGDAEAFAAVVPLAASDAPAVRNGALRALAGLAGPEDFEVLLRLVSSNAPGSRADEAAQATGLALARQLDRADPVFPASVAAALRSASPATRAALLARVAVSPHPVLRDAVRAGLEDDDTAVREAARGALLRTNDPALLDDALFLASEATLDRERDAAARAVVRLLRGPGAPPSPERLALLRALADAALTPGARRAVLDGLTEVPPGAAARLALEWLDDREIRSAVVTAVATLAPRVADAALAERVLRRALAGADDAESLRAIASSLEQVQARKGYLTAWRLARFPSPGTAPDRLLGTPFPPESPRFDSTRPDREAANSAWHALAVAPDPRRPALLRDGDGTRHGVVYALTWIRASGRTTARFIVATSSPFRAYLNRRMIAEQPAVREGDPTAVSLELEAGWNEVMVKLPETATGWSFTARLETEPDAPETLAWPGEVDAPRIVRENARR
jgi:HEAT repeat protein